MDQIFAAESLLPWLDSRSARIHLRLSSQAEEEIVHGKPRSPFVVVDSSSPLLRLYHGSFVTAQNNVIKDVFLLVQKDKYSFSEKNAPLGNREIDALWLQSAAALSDKDSSLSFIHLAAGSGGRSSLPLWRSLFYCENQQCFFHPPCPRCGGFLELCGRDDILLAAQLPPYTTSLKRFLFCPSCHEQTGPAAFYSYAPSIAATAMVKDRWGLIDDFALLVNGGAPAPDFPCQGCKNRGECYSGEKLAGSRLVPFAFYPFRMLITDARQLPVQDFLSLLAGGSYEEVINALDAAGEQGRAACSSSVRARAGGGMPLFFAGDARAFLEILYLKLAALEQISGISLSALKHLRHPDLRLTLDQFWVDFADHEGMLPYFWNFKVMPVSLGVDVPGEPVALKIPESLGLHALALLWFTVLLGNSRQSSGSISQALALLQDQKGFPGQADFFAWPADNDHAAFQATNIFWHPGPKQLPQPWLDLWHQALGLGWYLLRNSYLPDQGFSGENFSAQLRILGAEVKNCLFSVQEISIQPQAAEARVDEARPAENDNEAILNLLLGIRDKWRTGSPEQEERAAPVPPPVPPVQQGEAATVIMTGYTREDVAPPPQEDMQKTVIMGPEQLAAVMPPPPAGGGLKPRADAAGPPASFEPVAPPSRESVAPVAEQKAEPVAGEENGLEKTVVMGREQLAAMMANTPVAGSRPPDGGPGEMPAAFEPPGSVVAEPSVTVTKKTAPPVVDEAAGLEKTVVMNVNDMAAFLAQSGPKPGPEPPRKSAESGPAGGGSAPDIMQSPTAPADDGLPRTIMIDAKQLAELRKLKKDGK